MVNRLTKEEKLIEDIKDLEEYKKYIKIKNLVLNDEKLKNDIDSLYELEKEMVNAKELGLTNAFLYYSNKYDILKTDLENNVLFGLYLETVENIKSIINSICESIENNIDFGDIF